MVTYPGFYAVPGSAFPGQAWPGDTLFSSPAPPSPTQWLWHSSVPDMSVPGMAVPGLAGTGSPSFFLYLGHVPGYYLDYLDATTQKTLFAVPGNAYSMTPVNSRAGLTIPPPDNCWLTNTNKFAPRIVLHQHFALAVARAHSAGLHAAEAARPVPAQPQGSPLEARVVKPTAPSEAALTLAEARARNASLQAASRG